MAISTKSVENKIVSSFFFFLIKINGKINLSIDLEFEKEEVDSRFTSSSRHERQVFGGLGGREGAWEEVGKKMLFCRVFIGGQRGLDVPLPKRGFEPLSHTARLPLRSMHKCLNAFRKRRMRGPDWFSY